MTRSVPIRYREFWDVPRTFLAEHRGQLVLFDCAFDEDAEDFPDQYAVYLMPPLSEAELAGSWESLPCRAVRRLGHVSVGAVRFDASRRKEIDAELLDLLLSDQ